MGVEIERKFLLRDDSWRQSVSAAKPMRQGYLAARPECSVRVRLEGPEARINIKSATLGITRQEFEYPIPVADANAMLDTLCGGKSVAKIRHYVPYQGHLWEIDEFSGENSGLIVAEIELSSVTEHFATPAWLGDEVSGQARYYNVLLIEEPYKTW
jgi:adenylate cyclase